MLSRKNGKNPVSATRSRIKIKGYKGLRDFKLRVRKGPVSRGQEKGNEKKGFREKRRVEKNRVKKDKLIRIWSTFHW